MHSLPREMQGSLAMVVKTDRADSPVKMAAAAAPGRTAAEDSLGSPDSLRSPDSLDSPGKMGTVDNPVRMAAVDRAMVPVRMAADGERALPAHRMTM